MKKLNHRKLQNSWSVMQSTYKFMLLGCLALNFVLPSMAQNPGINALNKSLRSLFSPLTPPLPPKLFLFDMSAKTTHLDYWKNISYTVQDDDTWFDLYQELYHSAYDTSALLSPDSLYPRYLRYDKQVIPLFILNYDYNKLLEEALTTGNYFSFDTINNLLHDLKDRNNPYVTQHIFAAAPFDLTYSFSNPIFRIDPALIFMDSYNSSHFQNNTDAQLKIDFDDGNGYVLIDPTAIHDYQVNYPTAGMKTMKTAVFDKQNKLICLSQSKIKIKTAFPVPIASSTYSLPGIDVSLYAPCPASTSMPGKLVIYLSGYDPMDMAVTNSKMGRHIEEIYAEMIQNEQLVQLKNLGYSFLVVDWKNSRTDIRFNALYLVNLLEKLKCDLGDDAQQFVIIGESMGGLVARFALSYMESDAYLAHDLSPFFIEQLNPSNLAYLEEHQSLFKMDLNWKGCYKEKRHNTRLLITIDTPNQGATIPLSIQHLYKDVEGLFKLIPLGNTLSYAAKYFNVALDGMAAKEMLIYHISNKLGINYFNAHEKDVFFDQLKLIGNYPQHCKLVALSNGSLEGLNQENPYTFHFRQAGDVLLGVHLDKKVSLFGTEIPLFTAHADFKTNPNGQGNFVHANLGFYVNFPSLHLFKIRFHSVYIPLLPNYDATCDVLPFCTSAGGYLDLSLKFPGEGGLFDKDWIYSDGSRFCFVPIQSALDYGKLGYIPVLGTSIEDEDINLKISQTPYDVIIAYPGLAFGCNNEHVSYRNPPIYNSSITFPSNRVEDEIFYSCSLEDKTYRTLLGLEIGDEELFLENCNLAWPASYQAQFDIHVNERNRQYEYPNYFNPDFNIAGCYSKENPFLMQPTVVSTFYFDSNTSATGIGLSISAPFSGIHNDINAPISVCCENYIGARFAKGQTLTNVSNTTKLKLEPNPSNEKKVRLYFSGLDSEEVELNMYSPLGALLLKEKLNKGTSKSGVLDINFEKLNLNNGIYFIVLKNTSNSESVKLVINK